MFKNRGFFFLRKRLLWTMFYDPVNVLEVSKYTSPTLSMEDTFHGPQWVPETTDSTKPHMYYVFFHIHTYP